MAAKMILAFLGTLFIGLAYSMTIETTPEKIVSTITKSATISCVPDDVNGDVKSIETIEISKDDDLLAFVRQCQQTDCTLASSSEIQAEGSIGADVSQSFLKVTISEPTANDTGVYTCSMNYLDQADLIKDDKDEKNLEVEEMTVDDLEPALSNLTKRVEQLESQGSPSGTQPPVGPVAFQNPECYSAFATMNNKDYRAVRNTILKLPDVIFSKGEGYDAATGVFTAPCPGLYNFNLAVALKGKQSGAIVQIKKNADVIFRMYAADKSYDDQSSGSVVLHLEKGDTVFAYIEAVTGSRTFDRRGYTIFSGYLAMRLE